MDKPKIAGQPVSWGINYLPGWGVQLSAATVLDEMRQLGIVATEYQPGLFPPDAERARELLSEYGVRAIAGWVPTYLYGDDLQGSLEAIGPSLAFLKELGADIATVGAIGPQQEFEKRLELSPAEWDRMYAGLNRLDALCREYRLTAALHPHVGTAVETPSDIAKVQQNTRMGFCYDSGHIFCGGGDPVEMYEQLRDRIVHVHLKDVNLAVAKGLRRRTTTWAQAVGDGAFPPLGEGDLNLKRVAASLAASEYRGWYVIEQDVRLGPEQADQPTRNMKTSMAYLDAVLSRARA